MIFLSSYKTESGEVNWQAYKQAQIESGGACYQCNAYIFNFKDKGYKQLCSECKSLGSDSESVTSSNRYRCPKCQELCDVFSSDNYELFQEGVHEVYCYECEHNFEIETSISYAFKSPALLSED